MKITRPQLLQHPRQIVPRQAHSAHDVHFEKPHPFCVRNLRKRLGFENPQVVHEDVGLRHLLQKCGDAACGPNPRKSACFTCCRILPRAAVTRASVRPFTATLAPSCASAVAIASPMPAVDPETT